MNHVRTTLKITALTLTASCVTPAKPIDLQMGARGLGMGGAYTAIASDASSAYWNPAGLASVKDLTLAESNWLMPEVTGVNVNQITAAIPTEVGTLAGSWLLQYASLESGDGATYSEKAWAEHNFSLSGGRRLWDKLAIFENTAVGVTLNRYVLSSGDQSGAGTGFDLGFQTGLTHGLALGVMARALGADMMGDKVAPSWRVGLGWRWSNSQHALAIAADAATKDGVEYQDGIEGVKTNWKAFSGIEYAFIGDNWSVAIRGGGNSSFVNSRDVGEVTGGLGLNWNGFDFQYAYSYPLSGDLSLGQSHRFTLELQIMKLFASRAENGPRSGTTKASQPAVASDEELPDLPMGP